jgi:hypothetical protein
VVLATNNKPQSRWIKSGSTIKCVDSDGKQTETFKWRHPYWGGQDKELYKSRGIFISEDRKDVVVADFDGISERSKLRFFFGDCHANRSVVCGDLETLFVKFIPDQRGIIAGMVRPDWSSDPESGADEIGYLIVWDRNGTERLREGPYDFGGVSSTHIFYSPNHRFGYVELPDHKYLFLDLASFRAHFYERISHAGTTEVDDAGRFVVKRRLWKLPDGKVLTEKEFDASKDKLKIIGSAEVLHEIEHEFHF